LDYDSGNSDIGGFPEDGDGEYSTPFGGGHGSGGPGPKPDRKQCSPEMGKQGCLDCCLYNNTHVDGWTCNRKRNKAARKRCWEDANMKLSNCQVVTCDRHGIPPDPPIITSSVQP
jgi:hypothetical protein